MAYLILTLKDGRRAWYRDTDTRFDKWGAVQQVPLFDDEKGKEVSVAFAIDARRAWRSYCRSTFDSDLQIVHEKYGQPFEVGESSSGTPAPDVRQKHFVKFTNGLGLIVTPGNTPQGPCWFVKAEDIPAFLPDKSYTAIESVVGETPQEAASRAVDSWGQKILFRDPEEIVREEQERKQSAQQTTFVPGLRPGDRR
jgi:hypothetical protein